MCAYGLSGENGHYLKKPTGWLVSHPALAAAVSRRCPGNHAHEMCAGDQQCRRAQVYTPQLARAICRAVRD
eukprot:13663949-Alexandrium_andersonii.AAC.1